MTRPRRAAQFLIGVVCTSVVTTVVLLLGRQYRSNTDSISSTPLLSEVVVAVDEIPHTKAELLDHVGGNRYFQTPGEAEAAIQRFVDYLLLNRAAEQFQLADREQVSTVGALQRLMSKSDAIREVTEHEINAYYELHLAQYIHPREIELAYFFVPTHGAPDEEWRRIRSLEIQAQMIHSPREFQELLSSRNADVMTGEIGPVPCNGSYSDTVPEEVVRVGCTLALHAVSTPIDTPPGLYVVRLIAQLQARDTPLQRVRSQIKAILQEEQRQHARELVLAKLRSVSTIQIPEGATARLVGTSMGKPGSDRPPPHVPFGGS